MQQQSLEISNMILKSIGKGFKRNARFAHAHMIWHDTAMMPGERGNELPVEVAPGRVAMQHHDGFAASLVYIVHIKAIDRMIMRTKWETAAKSLVLDANHVRTPILCQRDLDAHLSQACHHLAIYLCAGDDPVNHREGGDGGQ